MVQGMRLVCEEVEDVVQGMWFVRGGRGCGARDVVCERR